MGAKWCCFRPAKVESHHNSELTLADIVVQDTELNEMTMEETRDVAGPSEQKPPSPTSGPTEVVEILDPVTLESRGESSNTNESSRNIGQDGYRASNTLWITGSFSDPIPNGFYSLIRDNRMQRFNSIPTLEELNALGDKDLNAGVILVDFERDQKLEWLKQLVIRLARGWNLNLVLAIKNIAKQVAKICNQQNLQIPTKLFGRHDFPLLGQIKQGSCRARALWFKVLADCIGIESRIIVGFPSDLRSSTNMDSHTHMSVVIVINNVEKLVDLMRYPGQLIPLSAEEIYMAHISEAENNSCGSPLKPNSPMYSSEKDEKTLAHRDLKQSGLPSAVQSGLSSSRSEPNLATEFLQRSQGKVTGEQHTASSSSKSDGTEKLETKRIMKLETPEISDDVVRKVREMREYVKQSRPSKDSSRGDRTKSTHLQKSVSGFLIDSHGQVSGEGSMLDPQKAISLPSSPQNYQIRSSEKSEPSHKNINHILNEVLESPMFRNKPLLPYEEWIIDFSELKVGTNIAGIGFFGVVKRGTWKGTDVAVKMLRDQDLTAENIKYFCNEISILSRLPHPNVILFLGACIEPPRLSMVTEFMERGSLYSVLHLTEYKKKLSCWERKLKMMRDICRGLMCIHRMGIVHLDLKSANCLMNKNSTVKISDFGLSRVMKDTTMRDTRAAETPEWMAPELIRKEPFSEKSDVFSFGVIMWEICTLSKPWEGVPIEEVAYNVANGARLELPEGPVPIGKLIADCWSEPKLRPSSGEIMTRLMHFENSLS